MADTYYCVLTDAGAALEAAAHAAKKAVVIKSVAVGDGGGTEVTPSASATALVNQVYEREPDYLEHDAEDPNVFWVVMTIPTDVGGFWIREVGVYAEALEEGEDPILMVHGSHAAYYKSTIQANQTVSHVLKLPVVVSNGADLELTVTDVGMATAEEIAALAAIIADMRQSLAQGVTTLEADVDAGGSVALPDGLSYVPGLSALQVFWNGLKLSEGQHYEEGEAGDDGGATSISLLFPAKTGDEFDFTVLPHSDANAVIGAENETVTALKGAVTQLQTDVTQLQSDIELDPAPAETYVDAYEGEDDTDADAKTSTD